MNGIGIGEVLLFILGIAGVLFIFYLELLIIRAVFRKKSDK